MIERSGTQSPPALAAQLCAASAVPGQAVCQPRSARSARGAGLVSILARDELRGTLADEIGLGKTAQTLAAGIFEADQDAARVFGAGDIERLFAPARLGSNSDGSTAIAPPYRERRASGGIAGEPEIRPHIELGDNSQTMPSIISRGCCVSAFSLKSRSSARPIRARHSSTDEGGRRAAPAHHRQRYSMD